MAHELAITMNVFTTALDHLFRPERQDQSFKEDALNIAADWLGILGLPTINNQGQFEWQPPLPPMIGALFGTQGITAPQGVFGGGDTYFVPEDPFDDRTETPVRMELVARSLFGWIGQAVLDTYTAFAAGDEDIEAAFRALGDEAIEGTAMVREIMGHYRVTSRTEISEELFRKSDAIRALTDYYREWDATRAEELGRQAYEVVQELRSNLGEEAVGELAPEIFATGVRSLPPMRLNPVSQPVNPLYVAFMSDLYDIFNKDATAPEGATERFPYVGFDSMWTVHGKLTDAINDLRTVNHGNFFNFQEFVNNNPGLQEWVESQGYNIEELQDVRALQNALTLTRQNVQRLLLEGIHEVEQRMSDAVGFEVKLEDLDPHQGLTP